MHKTHPLVLQAQKRHPIGVPSIKQVLPAEKQKGVRTIVRTPFYTSCLARYGVLHLLSVLSGGNIAFLREEGGTRSVTEGARATLELH